MFGALWWTGVSSIVYSCLMPTVSGIVSGSTRSPDQDKEVNEDENMNQ